MYLCIPLYLIKAKAGPGKKSLAFLVLFEEINALKRQLKPEKTASSKKRKAEPIHFLSTVTVVLVYFF
jgi:hypothetical protein